MLRRQRLIHLVLAAFAKACTRATSGAKAAYFFRSVAWIQYANRIVRYTLPSSMQKEIVSFDRAHILAPGMYQLKAPCAGQKLEDKRRYDKGRKNKKKSGKATRIPSVTLPLIFGLQRLRTSNVSTL